MRETCDYPGCNDQGAVYWKGLWCARHARAHGNLPALTYRFQDLHRMNVAADHSERPGEGTSGYPPFGVPSSGRAAIMGGSLPVGEPSSPTSEGFPARETLGRDASGGSNGGSSHLSPAPLSEAELLDILDRETWSEA